jgi:hypothetical protein
MSDVMLDLDLADDLVRAFQRSGYSTDEIKRICESDILVEFRKVLLGHASIVAIEHVIGRAAFERRNHHQGGGQVRRPGQPERRPDKGRAPSR